MTTNGDGSLTWAAEMTSHAFEEEFMASAKGCPDFTR